MIAPLESFVNQPITKLMLLGEPRLVLRLENVLLADFAGDAAIIRSDSELLQIMNRRASKAAALRRVARHYGIAMDQVMAIGDAANDVPMLDVAGVAVAMGNAPDAVKEVADWVAPSNNDQGVRAAMERYVLAS